MRANRIYRTNQIRNGGRKISTFDPFDKVLLEFCLNRYSMIMCIHWTKPYKFGAVSSYIRAVQKVVNLLLKEDPYLDIFVVSTHYHIL